MRGIKYIINKTVGEIEKLIDSVLFHESCINCGSEGKILCTECEKFLPAPEHDLPEHIFSLYEYRHPIIKKLLTDAKYRKKFSGLKYFGRPLYDACLDILSEYNELKHFPHILLIPVPMTHKKKSLRGFNQADIIAKAISMADREANQNNKNHNSSKIFTLSLNCVKKVRETTPQATIHSRQKRLQNPVGSFVVTKPKLIKNSFCIIIDDITTTGATINELRRTLYASGASHCIGLTVGH